MWLRRLDQLQTSTYISPVTAQKCSKTRHVLKSIIRFGEKKKKKAPVRFHCTFPMQPRMWMVVQLRAVSALKNGRNQ